MDTQLEELIEKVVAELKTDYSDVLLPAYFSEMIVDILELEVGMGNEAINYFIFLMRERTPKLFVIPSQGATCVEFGQRDHCTGFKKPS